MSRLRDYFRDNRPGYVTKFTESAVWVLNGLLLVAGLCMIAYALFFCITLHEIQSHGKSPVPPDLGTPTSSVISSAILSASKVNCPWFVYAFAASGLVVSITPILALLGLAYRSVHLVNCNVVFMCLLLASQVCIGVAFYVNDSARKIPDLPPGHETLAKFLEESMFVMPLVGLGVMVLEVITVTFNCCLQTIYVQVEEAAEDAEEEEEWRRRPLLRRERAEGSNPEAQRKQRNDPWSKRMRDQYGVDTSKMVYDPERDSLPPPLTRARSKEESGRCLIM